MTGHRVVFIALVLCHAIPIWAAEELPVLDVVSTEGTGSAFGSAAFVEVPTTGRSYLALVGGLSQNGAFKEDVDLYDTQSKTWSQIGISGGSYQPRSFAASAAVGSNLYLFGGQNSNGFVGFSDYGVISLTPSNGSILAEYSSEPTSGNIPAPRDLFQAVHHQDTGTVYMFGGRTPDGRLSDEVFSIDPSSGNVVWWTDMPRPLAEYGAAVQGRKVVIVGGLTYGASEDQVIVNDRVLAYDVFDNTWEERSPGGDVPDPVYFIGAGPIVRDKLWFAGGFRADGTPSDRTYTYSTVANRFDRGPGLLRPLGAYAIAPVPSSETPGDHVEVLIHGGDLGGTVSSETLRYTSTERVPPDYVVPAVADVQGAGAVFTSRAWLFNAGSKPMSLAASYKPRQGDVGPDLTSLRILPPASMLGFQNMLRELYGTTGNTVGGAGFRVTESDPSDLIGQTTITARGASGKEYGQAFEFSSFGDSTRLVYHFRIGSDGVAGASQETAPEHQNEPVARTLAPLRRATGSGETAYLFTTEDPVSNRVNVGGMAIGATAVTVTPELPLGNPLAPGRRIELDAGESFQVNNIYSSFGLSPGDANAVVAIEVESGTLVSYGSVLDGNGAYTGTSDPTTIRPVAGPGSKETYLLEIGSITGQGGSRFNGSASILNFDQDTAMIQADFFRRGSPGVAASATLSVPAGGVLGFSDFASQVLGVVGDVGTVRFTTDGSGIAVTGREYSVEDSNGTVVGTAGQLMRGLTEEDLLVPGGVCHGIGIRQGDGERSHIAFFNPGTSAATVEVSLFNGADGAFEGVRTFTVPGQQLDQLNTIIPLINPSHDGNEKRIEVTVDQPVYGAMFRVNPWNDPVTFDFHCK